MLESIRYLLLQVRKPGDVMAAHEIRGFAKHLRCQESNIRIHDLISGQPTRSHLDDVDAVPLGHEPVYLDGKIIGQTSSCAFGYRIGKPVALAHLSEQVKDGARVQVDIARQMFDATVTLGPLYDPDGTRMKV